MTDANIPELDDETYFKQLTTIAWIVLEWNTLEEALNYATGALLGLRRREDHLAVCTRINGLDGKQAIINQLVASFNLEDQQLRDDIKESLEHVAVCKRHRDNIAHMRAGFDKEETESVRHRGKIVKVSMKVETLELVKDHLSAASDEVIELFNIFSSVRDIRQARSAEDRQRLEVELRGGAFQFQQYRRHRLSLQRLE